MTTFLQEDFTPRMVNQSDYAWNWLFHGEFADELTGWFNYGYRYYIPEIGRWPSRDPLEAVENANNYMVTKNDMINHIDEFGLACGTPGIGDWLVPDKPGGFDFTEACNNHDECYSDCSISRSQCDSEFKSDAESVCSGLSTKPGWKPHINGKGGLQPSPSPYDRCMRTANTCYQAVNNFGEGACKNAREGKEGCCKGEDNYKCSS